MTRLWSLLALVALLLAPAGMIGSHAAMAMPHPATAMRADHCSERQEHHSNDDAGERAAIECAIACTALPGREALVGDTPPAPAATPEAAPALVLAGTRPEAATPPPRSS